MTTQWTKQTVKWIEVQRVENGFVVVFSPASSHVPGKARFVAATPAEVAKRILDALEDGVEMPLPAGMGGPAPHA
jgi:hypothetical protein